MPSKSRTATSSATGGLFVRVPLSDLNGRLFINALGNTIFLPQKLYNIFIKVWVSSFTIADELCRDTLFQRGSVS